MEGQQLTERVRELRRQGCTPKQIARVLGVPPATVAPLVRRVAAEQHAGEGRAGARGTAATEFWVSPGWSHGLTVEGGRRWPDVPVDDGTSGMVAVAAAREHGGRKVSFCGYLVDVYCLGVKNALGPRRLDRRNLPAFLADFFSAYDAPPLAAQDLAVQSRHVPAAQHAHWFHAHKHAEIIICGRDKAPEVLSFYCLLASPLIKLKHIDTDASGMALSKGAPLS